MSTIYFPSFRNTCHRFHVVEKRKLFHLGKKQNIYKFGKEIRKFLKNDINFHKIKCRKCLGLNSHIVIWKNIIYDKMNLRPFLFLSDIYSTIHNVRSLLQSISDAFWILRSFFLLPIFQRFYSKLIVLFRSVP